MGALVRQFTLDKHGDRAQNQHRRATSSDGSDCGPTSSRVLQWKEIASLADQQTLDLGPTSWESAVYAAQRAGVPVGADERVRLFTCLADAHIHDSVNMSMLRWTLFPDWEAARTPGWSVLAAMVDIDDGLRVAGLNAADSHGPFYKAVLYALSLLHTFAEFGADPFGADIGFTPSGLRSDIERGEFRVHAGGLRPAGAVEPTLSIGTGLRDAGHALQDHRGTVRVNDEPWSGYDAYTFFDIYLCDVQGVHAALADYYFWWSRRLLTQVVEGAPGADWYFHLADCAARAALAEVVQIAGTILHEYGHVKVGGGDHCLAAGGGKLSCAHYLDSQAFIARATAKLALPRPQFIGGAAFDPYVRWDGESDTSRARRAGRAMARFDYRENDNWWFGLQISGGPDLNCQPMTVIRHHCSFWRPNHGVGVSWEMTAAGAPCVRDGDIAGALRFGDPCHQEARDSDDGGRARRELLLPQGVSVLGGDGAMPPPFGVDDLDFEVNP